MQLLYDTLLFVVILKALLCHMSIVTMCTVMQAIVYMDFSSSGRQLALGFKDGSVAMVACLPWRGGQTRWDVVGYLRPHPAPTTLAGLAFGEAPSGVTKLFSLGTTSLCS